LFQEYDDGSCFVRGLVVVLVGFHSFPRQRLFQEYEGGSCVGRGLVMVSRGLVVF
jgi:hypothetical protein